MAGHAQLDPPRCSQRSSLIALAVLLLLALGCAYSQSSTSSHTTIQEVRRFYIAKHWRQIVRAVPLSISEPADLELYRGLALAQLGRDQEAERTFQAGLAGHPRDARFLTEMAGIAYKQKRFSAAKKDLRRALAINHTDEYSNNFLASIYFLEGNLEAALKYWNRIGKPQLSDLIYSPIPRLDPLILDRAFRFSPGAVWSRTRYLTSRTELNSLNLFPGIYYDLQSQSDGFFKLIWRNSERPRWNQFSVLNIIPMLRGLPYQSVYPEFYNLDGKGLNWRSFVRWDDQKRWYSTEIASPILQNPKMRFRLYFQDRNENWNITGTLSPHSSQRATFNLRRVAAGVAVQDIVNWRWQWTTSAEYSYRDFRGLIGIPQSAASFFTDSSQLALRSTLQHPLIQFPERRFSLHSSISAEVGKFFSSPLDKYGRVEGSLAADWLPQARGEDYETTTTLRAGSTAGQVPLDDLFMLGFDRDNDLWLRGHNDLRNGQKGAAPLGRNFILSSSDFARVVFHDGLFLVKVGPFLDTGDIYDSSRYFGSPKWLTDTGLQARIKILGRFEFVLGYGKDLRSGNNAFYSTVLQ